MEPELCNSRTYPSPQKEINAHQHLFPIAPPPSDVTFSLVLFLMDFFSLNFDFLILHLSITCLDD